MRPFIDNQRGATMRHKAHKERVRVETSATFILGVALVAFSAFSYMVAGPLHSGTWCFGLGVGYIICDWPKNRTGEDQ